MLRKLFRVRRVPAVGSTDQPELKSSIRAVADKSDELRFVPPNHSANSINEILALARTKRQGSRMVNPPPTSGKSRSFVVAFARQQRTLPSLGDRHRPSVSQRIGHQRSKPPHDCRSQPRRLGLGHASNAPNLAGFAGSFRRFEAQSRMRRPKRPSIRSATESGLPGFSPPQTCRRSLTRKRWPEVGAADGDGPDLKGPLLVSFSGRRPTASRRAIR